MKREWIIGLAIAAAAIGASGFAAPSRAGEAVAVEAVLPVSDILDTVRLMGLAPNRRAVRRGSYYVVHAIDPYGVELRVVADAHFGDILAVTPAAPYAVTPHYVRAPRIIHVPQADDGAPPRRHLKPRRRGEVPLPPKRATASAHASDAALTPIRPTPDFAHKTDRADTVVVPKVTPKAAPAAAPPAKSQ